jgi:selenocysteine lyase/cysteine desulfurase
MNNLLLVVDASQTAGVVPIHMTEMGIDVLCFTGHKGLMGPQGTGGLCIGADVEIRPFKVGGTGIKTYEKAQPQEYPTRLEAGTLNSHGIAGLNAALDYIEGVGLDVIRSHELQLAKRFYEGIRRIDGVKTYGDFSSWDRAAIVTLNVRDFDSAQVSDYLAEHYGIATRPGGHCAPRLHEALGTVEQGAVRFSFGWHNTEEDVDAAIRAIAEVAEV